METPSPWFTWHAELIGPGTRVLDVACSWGRHAAAAAERGASVVAVDADAGRLRQAEQAARDRGLDVEWVHANLEGDPLPAGPFDVVMIFYYLDRQRMSDFLEAVKPGGYLLAETYLEEQRLLGEGPTSDEHLLKSGELTTLVNRFEIVLAREVMEIMDGRPRMLASVLARRPPA